MMTIKMVLDVVATDDADFVAFVFNDDDDNEGFVVIVDNGDDDDEYDNRVVFCCY